MVNTPDSSAQHPPGSTVEGRIFFPGNPWPLGHRVVSCEIVAAVHPNWGAYVENPTCVGPALSLAIELTTADYDEDDPSDRDGCGDDDWTSKIVWNNYGSCTLGGCQSSQTPGIRVSNGVSPFVFDQAEYRLRADPLPVDWEAYPQTRAFRIYLLGHDAVADHDIHLHSRLADGSYSLDWTGRIALAYAGDTQFKYPFRAQVAGVKFKEICLWYFDVGRAKEYLGIDLDPRISARDYLAPFVADPDAFTYEKRTDGIGRTCTYAVPIRK